MTSPVNAYNDFEGLRRYQVEGLDPHPISVTSLIKMIAPPIGLVKWFDKKLVNAALEEMQASGDIDKARYAGLEARFESNDEADLGTSVHFLTEVSDQKLLNRDITTGKIANEKQLRPYVAQWEKARDAHSIEIIAVEVTLVNPEYGYAGTADRICVVPDISVNPIVLDIKSGKRIFADVALQCAALSRCTHIMHDDGTLEPIPWKLSSMFGAVAHVRPRSCKISPLDLNRAWEYFKFLPKMAEWRSEKVPVVGDVLEPDPEKLMRAELRRKIAALPPDLAISLRDAIKQNEKVQTGSTTSWNLSQLDIVDQIFKPYEAQARERNERLRAKYGNLTSLALSVKILNCTSGRTSSINELSGEEVDLLLEL